MNEEELNQKFQIFEGQIYQIEEQLRAVEQAILDMETIKIGLDELKGNTDKTILSSIGRGIYIETKLISEDILVDVGGKNYVKKTIPETKELISEQGEKLKGMRTELEKELDKINNEITKTMEEFQGKNHVCSDENCNHKH